MTPIYLVSGLLCVRAVRVPGVRIDQAEKF